MTYKTFEIVINKITIAYCIIDQEHNKFEYVPVQDETLSTILQYIVDEPNLTLTISSDDAFENLQALTPKDELFLKALNQYLPRKYHVSNVQTIETDKSIKSYLNYLLKGDYLE